MLNTLIFPMICHKTPKSTTIIKIYRCLKTLSCASNAYILKRKDTDMTNFKNGLGSNIKYLRKVRNITQEDLAGVIGIHSRQLSKIETGEHFPSCKTLEKVCITLNIQPKELFDFEFLTEEYEGALSGTANETVFQVSSTPKNNVYQLRNAKEKDKTCTDKSMANTAKNLNKPIFVEYFDEKKSSKIVVFYPDGKEKIIRNSVNVEAQRNLNYMVGEFRKISKDKKSSEFIKLALDALKSDSALAKLSNLVEGMKLARGVNDNQK